MSEENTKLTAYAAIAAIWLVWLADLAIDIRTMFDDDFWQNMAHLAPWRVQAATFALFLFPLVSGGVYVLNKSLRRPVAVPAAGVFVQHRVHLYAQQLFLFCPCRRVSRLAIGCGTGSRGRFAGAIPVV